MSTKEFWITFSVIFIITIFLLFKFKKIKVKVFEGEITMIGNFCNVIPSFSLQKNNSSYSNEEEKEFISPFISFFKSQKEYIEDVKEVKIHGKKVWTNFKINRNNIEEMKIGNKIKIIYIYFFGKKVLFNK